VKWDKCRVIGLRDVRTAPFVQSELQVSNPKPIRDKTKSSNAKIDIDFCGEEIL
jgi:hypothetical protein